MNFLVAVEQIIHEFLSEALNNEEEEQQINNERFKVVNMQRRILRDASNPFAVPPHHFVKYYRMNQEVALRLIHLLEGDLVGDRLTTIPVHLQVLITLRFMAEGSLQRGLAQDYNHPIGQSSASKCLRKVQNAILRLHDLVIQFPVTADARQRIQNGIPGIIGVVDCFLVNFKRPAENEEAFFNFRVGCAMNVQIIVDSEYNILNIRICPGSNNDKFVWQFSQAKEYLQYLRDSNHVVQTEGYYYVLGDSGYTPSPTLLTPDLNTVEESPASTYTIEHVGTRRYVEQTIGILTNVWRAIKRCRKLQYSPGAVARIINVACILHNFRKRNGFLNVANRQPNVVINHAHFPRRDGDFVAGITERNRLIEYYYA